eukprot:3206334-Ditylum_brightwellii.AAC.1
MPSSLHFNKPSNKQYHNLCTHKKPPEGIEELLGLGHKSDIQKRKSNPEIKKGKKQTIQSTSKDSTSRPSTYLHQVTMRWKKDLGISAKRLKEWLKKTKPTKEVPQSSTNSNNN